MKSKTPHILYEDKEIIVCQKPHGLATQSRRPGTPDLEHILLCHLAEQARSKNKSSSESKASAAIRPSAYSLAFETERLILNVLCVIPSRFASSVWVCAAFVTAFRTYIAAASFCRFVLSRRNADRSSKTVFTPVSSSFRRAFRSQSEHSVPPASSRILEYALPRFSAFLSKFIPFRAR